MELNILILKFKFKFASSKIKGIKINPPAGEGTPSKKLIFQFSILVNFC